MVVETVVTSWVAELAEEEVVDEVALRAAVFASAVWVDCLPRETTEAVCVFCSGAGLARGVTGLADVSD